MPTVNFDNTVPKYRNTSVGSFLTLDTIQNRLEINNGSTSSIAINPEGFSNGTQSLPFTQMYAKINAVEACKYPAPASNILSIQDTVTITSASPTGPTGTNQITNAGGVLQAIINTGATGYLGNVVSVSNTTESHPGKIWLNYSSAGLSGYTGPTGEYAVILQAQPQVLSPSSTIPQLVITDNTKVACGIQLSEANNNGVFAVDIQTAETTVLGPKGILATDTYGSGLETSLGPTGLVFGGTGATYHSTFRVDYCQIQSQTTGDSFSFNQNLLQINTPSNPAYLRCNPADGLTIQNDVMEGSPTSQTTVGSTQISIQDLNGEGQMNTKNLLFVDSTNNLQAELNNDPSVSADPFLRFQNNVGVNNYLYFNELNANDQYCFRLNNNNRFFKQMNPFSFQQYRLNDKEIVQKYMSFVIVRNIDNLSVLELPSDYLDDAGLAGWSCFICNYSTIPVNINMSGNYLGWFSSDTGGSVNAPPFTLAAGATKRFTLIYEDPGEYVWAISN